MFLSFCFCFCFLFVSRVYVEIFKDKIREEHAVAAESLSDDIHKFIRPPQEHLLFG